MDEDAESAVNVLSGAAPAQPSPHDETAALAGQAAHLVVGFLLKQHLFDAQIGHPTTLIAIIPHPSKK